MLMFSCVCVDASPGLFASWLEQWDVEQTSLCSSPQWQLADLVLYLATIAAVAPMPV